GLDDERRRVNDPVDLEVEVEQIQAGGRCGGCELDLRTRYGSGSGLCALRVNVQVGQVTVAKRDQVTECAEVRLDPRHRGAVLRDTQSEHRGRADVELALELHVVTVDTGSERLSLRWSWREFARDLD